MVLVVLGVPIICPLVLRKVKPVGKLGLTLNVYAPTPPLAVTGINAVAATFCVNVLVAIVAVTINAGGGGGGAT